jgi:hypothetical protein
VSLQWRLGILLFLLAIMFSTTPFFGRVETSRFSAYAACRKVAMATKGYAVWTHQRTTQRLFRSRVVFSDGFNRLDCRAIGVGPFWIVRMALPTFVDCSKNLGNGKIIMCPEEYFGVSP